MRVSRSCQSALLRMVGWSWSIAKHEVVSLRVVSSSADQSVTSCIIGRLQIQVVDPFPVRTAQRLLEDNFTSNNGSWTEPADSSLAGMRVVAAYPGGSDDIASSRDRVAGFTEDLRKMDVEIVDSAPKVAKLLPKLKSMVTEGLVTIEKAHVIFYRADPAAARSSRR